MPLKDDLYDRTPDDEREERALLGFQRQPEVRWLTPSLLAKSGVEVLVSGTFGKFADKREIQTTPQGRTLPPPADAKGVADQGPFDYAQSPIGDEGLWVDYLSDTGDGWNATYSMAWLLAREQLAVAGAGAEALPRGRILLLGGDQVYPSAGPIPYEDRFIGPFASALPSSPPASAPDLYATPGNHDWYDGLASFLRVFCTKDGWIGGWKTRQRRSYYAIRLPNDWWIWAIDIQLDTYIDDVQLDYFRRQPLEAGHKVILMTAKPSWIKAKDGRLEPVSWKYLAFFEDRMIRDREARLAIVLTGDLHHYARYEPDEAGAVPEAPTRITAGGGGAYLSATHTLPAALDLQSMARKPNPDDPARADVPAIPRATVRYDLKSIYPTHETSAGLGRGITRLRTLNPEFAQLFGGVYALIAFAMLAALNGAPGPIELTDRVTLFLAHAFGPLTLLLVAVLFGAAYVAADIKADPTAQPPERPGTYKRLRGLVTAVHGLVHLTAVTAIVLLGITLLGLVIGDDGDAFWLLLPRLGMAILVVGLAFAAGRFLGTAVWAQFMLGVHRRRAEKAPNNANEVFTGQSIVDHKNFLRMRFDRRGGLTIFPLGVDAICKTWDHQPEPGAGSRFAPRDRVGPRVKLVDGPLRYDAAGNRVDARTPPAPPAAS